jgi:hypothetical protein
VADWAAPAPVLLLAISKPSGLLSVPGAGTGSGGRFPGPASNHVLSPALLELGTGVSQAFRISSCLGLYPVLGAGRARVGRERDLATALRLDLEADGARAVRPDADVRPADELLPRANTPAIRRDGAVELAPQGALGYLPVVLESESRPARDPVLALLAVSCPDPAHTPSSGTVGAGMEGWSHLCSHQSASPALPCHLLWSSRSSAHEERLPVYLAAPLLSPHPPALDSDSAEKDVRLSVSARSWSLFMRSAW